jgi:hypothetical protein
VSVLVYIFTDIEPDIRITPTLYCDSRLVASRSGSNARRRRRRLRSHRESAGDVEVLKALPPGLAMFLTLPRGLRRRRPLGIRRQWDARRATSRNRDAGNVFGSRRAGSRRHGCSASSAGSADRGVRVCGLSHRGRGAFARSRRIVHATGRPTAAARSAGCDRRGGPGCRTYRHLTALADRLADISAQIPIRLTVLLAAGIALGARVLDSKPSSAQ